MNETVFRMRLMSLIVLALATLGVWGSWFVADTEPSPRLLEVSFLDVGQGDATLIETVGGVQVLIDGGPNGSVLRELSSELPLFDTTLDMVIATHQDSDHIGGLIDVLERYEVEQIVMTENEGGSPAAAAYAAAAATEGATITMARRGQTWQLDASTTLEVLFPETDATDMESNASSIVVKLSYGQHCFILTGDAPKRIEEYLVLTYGEHLDCEVLKVGHHGSRTSTSEMFVQEVDPDYAVISYGGDNRYGHPHVEVTDVLFNERVETYETAKEGSITITSNGVDLTIE